MTEPVIPENIQYLAKKTVEESDTASQYGSGLLPVFATPALIAFIENTAHRALNQYLTPELTSVGIHINIDHLKATKVGQEVVCEVKIVKTENRKIFFETWVWENNTLIGKGFHTRMIVDKIRFMDKIGIK